MTGRLLLVCLGGAAGSGARYLVAMAVASWTGATFPYGTFAVNVTGSFLLGVLMQLGLDTNLVSPEFRLAAGTGFLGGYTTYSTFNYETLQLFEKGAWVAGVVNVVATVIVCLLAGLAGIALARALGAP